VVPDDDNLASALRRSELHLAAAQRITRCGSWELGLANLEDLSANELHWSDEVFRIFGHEPGAIPVSSESFFAAVHPDDRARVSAAVERAIATGTPYEIDHRVVRPDGSIRIVHEASEIQRDPTGRPLRMVGTVQDVTDQRATDARLAIADRLTSVGELAAGVAHEINNPLAAVSANLELLQRYLDPSDARALECVRDARDAAARVQAIVRDLMTYAHVSESPAQPDDVRRAIEAAVRLAMHDLKHRARVVLDLADVPLVEASESRLVQVFLNLLRNAAHAMPEGLNDDHEVRITLAQGPGECVTVAIADTGCGIPRDVQTRIFSPFFTTKPAGVGTGLGLSICQRIVGELGGEISFDSEVGQGTVFRVTLPAPDRIVTGRTRARQ
jgi:PAS domain S-box-containing protein